MCWKARKFGDGGNKCEEVQVDERADRKIAFGGKQNRSSMRQRGQRWN